MTRFFDSPSYELDRAYQEGYDAFTEWYFSTKFEYHSANPYDIISEEEMYLHWESGYSDADDNINWEE